VAIKNEFLSKANLYMWIDTHCHLVDAKLEQNFTQIIENAKLGNVSKILNIAYNPNTVLLALEQNTRLQCKNYLYSAVGIQPHDANFYTDIEAKKILEMAQKNKCVAAIGEIGLDNFHKIVDLSTQKKCFEHFLEIALECKLPVVVHVRETFVMVYERLKEFCLRGGFGVVHCFTGTMQEAESFLNIGMHISFSGIVTFKNSDDLRMVAKKIPAERILIETDSPYLSPVPFRGQLNQPANVAHTGVFLAHLRGEKVEDFALQTSLNSMRLFERMNEPCFP
jgi:TatD DNase family protein